MSEWDEQPVVARRPGECAWAFGGSDIGLVRPDNEDAWLCDPERGLFIVADGMGGHVAGERASHLAIETLDATLSAEHLRAACAEGEEAVRTLLCDAMVQTNAAILQLADEHPEWSGMGTTAVIAVLDGQRLYVANVGDSRAYLVHGERAVSLTRDHSVAAMLVANDMLDRAEMREHPLRNRLTMVLGADYPLDPAFIAQTLQPGERIILCSDGLWDMLEDSDIAQIVYYSANPREAAYSLITAADDAGGRDNTTVVALFPVK